MASARKEVLFRNVSRREILEYLGKLGFKQSQTSNVFLSGSIKLQLFETRKRELGSIRIDETNLEIEGPEEQVLRLKEKIRFHFLRAGG